MLNKTFIAGSLAISLALFSTGCGGGGGGGDEADSPGTGTGTSTEIDAEGLTLYAPMTQNGSILLVNQEGETVHEWKTDARPNIGKLLPDGSITVLLDTRAQPDKPFNGTPRIQKLDWEGNVLWEYTNNDLHHDVSLMPNGNVMAILWEELSAENLARVSPARTDPLWSDLFVEIDTTTGEIIWEWHAQDHLTIEEYTVTGNDSELTHANAVEYLAEGNAFNGEASILVSFRHIDTILVADYATAEIAWEFGPGILEGQHNPSLLENGNILVYDNRKAGEGSRVAEIFPETGEIVWEYEAEGFYSGHISGAQRLLDGNTLICEGGDGRIFEVDPSGNVIWEHFSPEGTQVFRAYRYEIEDIEWPDLSIFE